MYTKDYEALNVKTLPYLSDQKALRLHTTQVPCLQNNINDHFRQ